MALASVFFWFIFHCVFALHRKPIIFLKFVKLSLLPAIEGVGLALLIEFVYFSFISLVFLHKFMSYNFSINCGDNTGCNKIVWDYLSTQVPNQNFDGLRKMRFGIILIHFGIYITFLSTRLIKTSKPSNKNKESFNKNVWQVNLWEQYNFLWVWALFLIMELYRINFSFTTVFGNNVWVFIAVYKIVGILAELIIIYYVKDYLQLLVFSTEIGLIENLTTAGADDLIDFLKGYFIGLAMLKVERIYFDYILNYLITKGKKFLLTIFLFVKNMIKKEDDEYDIIENENNNEPAQQNTEKEEAYSLDSSQSQIFISHQDLNLNAISGVFNENKPTVLNNTNKKHPSIELSKRLNQSIKYNYQKSSLTELVEEEEEKDFSEELDKYSMYCNQTIGTLYLPFAFWLIWAFYDEINIAPSWGIKDKFFFYYFLFSLVLIPIQLVMDFLFYNVEYWYNGLDFEAAMSHWMHNFQTRTNNWIGFDDNPMD